MEKHKNKCFNVFQNKRLILVFFGDCGSGGGVAPTLSLTVHCKCSISWVNAHRLKHHHSLVFCQHFIWTIEATRQYSKSQVSHGTVREKDITMLK